jgi:hypothetical protein
LGFGLTVRLPFTALSKELSRISSEKSGSYQQSMRKTRS